MASPASPSILRQVLPQSAEAAAGISLLARLGHGTPDPSRPSTPQDSKPEDPEACDSEFETTAAQSQLHGLGEVQARLEVCQSRLCWYKYRSLTLPSLLKLGIEI